MKNYRGYHNNNISFIDMLFNIIVVFVLLFFISIMIMNPPSKKKDIEAKADVLIVMTWPDFNPHDIDLWIKPPNDIPIYYNRRENSFLFLDKDDLGSTNNYVMQDDKKVYLPSRREVVSFRGREPGRYVANVHFYLPKTVNEEVMTSYDNTPIPVTVELIQINPAYKILARKEILLTRVKEEKTAFSFIVTDDAISNIVIDIEEPFIQNTVNLSSRAE